MDDRDIYNILLEKTDTTYDRQGTPMDKEIKPFVAALWLHGFLTSSSCAGHVDSKNQGPYVHIIPPDFDAKYNLFEKLVSTGKITDARLLKRQIYESSLEVYGRLFVILRQFYAHTTFNYDHIIVLYAQLNGEIYLYFNDVRMADTLNSEDRKAWLKKCHLELRRLIDFMLILPRKGE